MLRATDNNTTMLAKINHAIDLVATAYKSPSVQEPTLAQEVKQAVATANDETGNWSGTKSVAWVIGGCEHTISWRLKLGSIFEITMKRFQPGLIRVTSEERILN